MFSSSLPLLSEMGPCGNGGKRRRRREGRDYPRAISRDDKALMREEGDSFLRGEFFSVARTILCSRIIFGSCVLRPPACTLSTFSRPWIPRSITCLPGFHCRDNCDGVGRRPIPCPSTLPNVLYRTYADWEFCCSRAYIGFLVHTDSLSFQVIFCYNQISTLPPPEYPFPFSHLNANGRKEQRVELEWEDEEDEEGGLISAGAPSPPPMEKEALAFIMTSSSSSSASGKMGTDSYGSSKPLAK